MQTITKPFVTLTAADLMTRDPITIPEHMSLRTAAHQLSRGRITGAPVINALGACIGVLSATDFMQWAEGQRKGQPEASAECVCADWQMLEPEELPSDEVREFMSNDPVTARPATGITDLARMMIDAHIHRIIIVDAQNRPIGIVSSTDILAAVAYAGRTLAG
jgi:CBS-domain-containing membrane protein